VTFTLDPKGGLAEAYCPDRPRAILGGFTPTPWRGHFWDYGVHGTVRLANAGAAS
jgi:hypothetical protein